MTKEALLDLLANSEIDKLFEQLKKHQDNAEEYIQLKSQWNSLKSRQFSGTVSDEQANLETAKVRKGLLHLVNSSFDESSTASTAPTHNGAFAKSNRMLLLGLGALLAGIFLLLLWQQIKQNPTNPSLPNNEPTAAATTTSSSPKVGNAVGKLDLSGAQPITLAPGDNQYERIYSVTDGVIKSVGGGKNLITLKIILNCNNILNCTFYSNKLRLEAPELPGLLAPSNHVAEVVDGHSSSEREFNFEVDDKIKQFSII